MLKRRNIDMSNIFYSKVLKQRFCVHIILIFLKV